MTKFDPVKEAEITKAIKYFLKHQELKSRK